MRVRLTFGLAIIMAIVGTSIAVSDIENAVTWSLISMYICLSLAYVAGAMSSAGHLRSPGPGVIYRVIDHKVLGDKVALFLEQYRVISTYHDQKGLITIIDKNPGPILCFTDCGQSWGGYEFIEWKRGGWQGFPPSGEVVVNRPQNTASILYD